MRVRDRQTDRWTQTKRERDRPTEKMRVYLLMNYQMYQQQAKCISGTYLLLPFPALLHWDTSCTANLQSYSVIVN